MLEGHPRGPVADTMRLMKAKTAKGLWFVAGIVAGGLLAVAVPLVVLATGVVDMSAAAPPGALESAIAPWALDRSMARHAPRRDNPFKDAASALPSGMKHYQANCVICHGAPEVPGAELSLGLNPPVPPLYTKDTQSSTDGQLFWVIRNGIRMTGMPAFQQTRTDNEIWQIVAFVRHLPALTDQERKTLEAAVREEGDHHEGGG